MRGGVFVGFCWCLAGRKYLPIRTIDEFFSDHIDFAQNHLGLMSPEQKEKHKEDNNKIPTSHVLKRKKKELLFAGGSMVFAEVSNWCFGFQSFLRAREPRSQGEEQAHKSGRSFKPRIC